MVKKHKSIEIKEAVVGTSLQKLEGICAEIYSRWDADMRSGKLLGALAGGTPFYRQDVTDVREALAVADSLQDTMKRARWALEAMINLHCPDPAGMALIALNDLDRALSALDRTTKTSEDAWNQGGRSG